MNSEGSFVKMLKTHMKAEANMIKACAKLEKKVHTAAAKLLLAEMRLDSVKHEGIIREILNVIEKRPPPPPETKLWDYRIESFVDMEAVRKELQRHVNVEADMLSNIEKVIRATPDEAVKVLLSHIAEDERKHHKNMELIIKESYAFVM
jgi:rubrerythrin